MMRGEYPEALAAYQRALALGADLPDLRQGAELAGKLVRGEGR
jgi:hypothetical protein